MKLVIDGESIEKEEFKSSKEITLDGEDGVKTVKVNFYDANNNYISSVEDSIILDTTLVKKSFLLDGASKKGDILKLSLDIGELDANIVVNIPSIQNNLALFDNGTNGDGKANDGIYERDILIDSQRS